MLKLTSHGALLIEVSIIVASGLIALVDDCIKSRFHQKRRVYMSLPMLHKTPFKLNTEYVGAKRLMDEVFNRREKPSTPQPTPSRQAAK